MVKRKAKESLDDVFADYIKYLDQYIATQRNRDFVAGNKYVPKIAKAAAALRHNFGAQGRAKLVELLGHADSEYRSHAASYALDFAEARAVTVLTEIEKADQPFEGTAAHYCLKGWREGTRQMPGGLVTLEPGENYPAFNELH